ncbi:MAG: right-handed parallel beta-helix repeat-containing protein [Candidatus Micrarchaeota archaeon]|nr:right-handed parallel beta-helix repeat-containing protein [Candidatus Micrarchaeota archaeon]
MDVSSMPDEQPQQPEPAHESEPQAPEPPAQEPPQPAAGPPSQPSAEPESQPEGAPSTPPSEPEQPAQPYAAPAPPSKPGFKLAGGLKLPANLPQPRILLSGLAVIVVIALVLVFSSSPGTRTTTTLPTTTLQQINLSQISGCETISKPGTYYLQGNINYTGTSGACITVTSSDVTLVGNQHNITGSGPYTGVSPFSYGIELRGVSNVTVSSFNIARFSYDVFLNSSSGSSLISNNLTASTLSGVYFLNASNNELKYNTISHSQSNQGGIYIRSGRSNLFLNNTLANNAYYGLVVNTTLNNFTQNVFANNPADLVCNTSSASRYSNSFSGSTCSVNDYCGFASCASNLPFNVSSIRLSPGAVKSCGSIYSPGNYTLSKSVSAATYINASNPGAKGVSCIEILAPNVNFNCANKQINNSGYGIYIGSSTNVNVSNCVLYNNNYGLLAQNSFNPGVSNTTAINNTYGIYISNTTSGRIVNDNLLGNNTYGIFINSSSGLLINNVRAHNNTYGVYTASGSSNFFNGGVSNNNTKADLYCSAATYNSTTNLAQSFSCGRTDCTWAASSCSQLVPATLNLYPVSNCKTITQPGNYSLTQNVIASSTCFNIKANNVAFNCASHLITGPSPGSAFLADNRNDVSISNCTIKSFNVGINASNSTDIRLNSIQMNATSHGVSFSRVSGSYVSNVKAAGESAYAFNFTNVNTSSIVNNYVAGGVSSATGFVFVSSHNNSIGFNNATRNPAYGFDFINSVNNTVYNNSAFGNAHDYVCSGSSTGLFSNPIGVNYGLSKRSCSWLIALNPLLLGPSCSAIFTPTQVTLTHDFLFTPGSTCFSVYTNSQGSANSTSINCAGYTVYAPNGGTFVSVSGASNVKVQNCLLWNFTTGVLSNGDSAVVYNNTFAAGESAVTLTGGSLQSIYKNVVDNNTNGMIISNVSRFSIYNNQFFNNTLSIALYNSTSSNINNNTAINSAVGIYLSNVTATTVQNNMLTNSSTDSILCAGSALSQGSGDFDGGGNVCSRGVTKSNCVWIKSSATCTS